jgi:hypothetical protein
MIIERPKRVSSPLEDLASILGSSGPSWATVEDCNSINYQNTELPEIIASTLDVGVLRMLSKAYGDALFCMFSFAGEEGLKVSEQITQSDVETFQDEIRGAGKFQIDFRLNKQKLIDLWFGKLTDDNNWFLYLFPKAAEQDFLMSFSELEKIFWSKEPNKKVMVLVPDLELALNGEMLTVLGGRQIKNWKQYSEPSELDANDLEWVNKNAQNILRWQRPWVRYLSPAHLWLEGSCGEDCKDLVTALQVQFINLFMLYTADRTVEHEGKFISTYSGAKFTTEINWISQTNLQEPFDWTDIQNLREAYFWAYNPTFKVGDRLPLLQVNVAKTVRGIDRFEASTVLVHSANKIFNDLDEQWIEVIENRIDAFSELKEKLADQARESINYFTNQVTEIIDSLSKSALALVGVLIGSFIAALFKDSFNAVIFTLGMLIYAAYLIIFPLIYNMINQWMRFKTQEAIYRRNEKTIAKQLEERTVEQIVGDTISKTVTKFKVWYFVTIVIYILLVGIVIYAAFAGPEWVADGSQS